MNLRVIVEFRDVDGFSQIWWTTVEGLKGDEKLASVLASAFDEMRSIDGADARWTEAPMKMEIRFGLVDDDSPGVNTGARRQCF